MSGDHHQKTLDYNVIWDSTIETYVLWWQNDAGRARWPVTPASIAAMRQAFTVKPLGAVETAGATGAVAAAAEMVGPARYRP